MRREVLVLLLLACSGAVKDCPREHEEQPTDVSFIQHPPPQRAALSEQTRGSSLFQRSARKSLASPERLRPRPSGATNHSSVNLEEILPVHWRLTHKAGRWHFHEGSDIWNANLSWANVTIRHPLGVVSNLRSKRVQWAQVSYLSLNSLYIVSLVAYPAIFIACLLLLTVLMGVCMLVVHRDEEEAQLAPPQEPAPVGPASSLPWTSNVEDLSPRARSLFWLWSLFCRSIPVWMVFGTPLLLLGLTYPYPQEVFMLLVVVSSVMVFANGIYMAFFCPFMLFKMRQAAQELPPSAERNEKEQVRHWLILPNYKEDLETLSGCLQSVANSAIARSQISVLLAMEEREDGAFEKAEVLKARFAPDFLEVAIVMHPADLPKDPPGKASNVAWAFKWLSGHVKERQQDPDLVLLTVADADSDFHRLYFQGLGRQFLEEEAGKRALRIWQAPVFHVKNYHRQPMLLIVGTMVSAMAEIAVLNDPNSIRFPYSTYSLSLQLARNVGGWDADWIAEDWHMGIKCFLLTMGRTQVQPVLLPTINYVPEAQSWWGTVSARWTQAKRHALGFSDLSYYFMMMPLLFCRLSILQARDPEGPNHEDFWRTFFFGIAYVIRLVNTHVLIGIMTLYMIMSVVLKTVMYSALEDVRHIGQLFEKSSAACSAFMIASVLSMVVTSISYQVVYAWLKDRMEKPVDRWNFLFLSTPVHWAYTFISCLVFSAVYFVALALAVWIAAIQVLLCGSTFKYEVAAKPTKDTHL